MSCTRLDLPEPETPVTTVRARLGIRTVSSHRLWIVAPSRTIHPSLADRGPDGRARTGDRPSSREVVTGQRFLARLRHAG